MTGEKSNRSFEGIAAVDGRSASRDVLGDLSSEHIVTHHADRAVRIHRANEVSGVVVKAQGCNPA